MRTRPVAPLFDLADPAIHKPATVVERDGVRIVSSRARPWSYIAKFPAHPDRAVSTSQGHFGWVVRVQVTLEAGGAAVAFLGLEVSSVSGEVLLRRGFQTVDLVVGDLSQAEWLLIRRTGEDTEQ